ncbi:hypothetical protein SLA2020_399700 [Shorea laevis]
MPRGSSGGRSGSSGWSSASSSSSSRSSSSSSLRNPPKKVKSAPPPAPAPAPVQGNNGSFLGAIADGISWGAGSSFGQRAVDAILGPRVVKHETIASSALETVTPAAAPDANSFGNSEGCGGQSKAFTDCLNSHVSYISKCQVYMDMLQECRTSSGVA